MSGQIKADVYMKLRLHLRWGMYMRSSANDRGRPATKNFTLLLDASCRMISCNASFAAAWTVIELFGLWFLRTLVSFTTVPKPPWSCAMHAFPQLRAEGVGVLLGE